MHYDFSLLITVITIGVVMGAILGTCAYLILLERKVAAYVQDRLGPNRVGPFGLLQPIADGLKFLFKEQVIPAHVDRLFYLVAPAIATTTALLAFAVVPFGPTRAAPNPPWPQTTEQEREFMRQEQQQAERDEPTFRKQVEDYNHRYQFVIAPHVDVGIVFVFAVASLAAYAIILGGWSSNNKYSFLGSLRSSAQLISYEIPMGMSVLGVILLAGSVNLERIIGHQVHAGWLIWYQPLAFLLFLVSIFAETNRLPFDLPEAEQELVGGYHTEYSGLKFGMFFLGEYTHMVTTSFLAVALFLGGWYLPWVTGPESNVVVRLIVFAAKMFGFILLYMFIRWTLPRFRFDQLMGMAWQVLIPLALANLVCVMVVKHLAERYGLGNWTQLGVLLPVSLVLFFVIAALFARRPERPRRAVTVIRGHEWVEVMTR